MFECVIPARNEADRVAGVVADLRGLGTNMRITVVDNDSDDGTADAAAEAGAEVIHEPRQGKGFAVITGLRQCQEQYVFVCDADIQGLEPRAVAELHDQVSRGNGLLGRLSLERMAANAPVTTLVARPMLRALGFDRIREPLGGLCMAQRAFVLEQHLPGGWGFDVGLTLAAAHRSDQVIEHLVTDVTHRRRPLPEYAFMAEQVAEAILRATGAADWNHSDCVRCSHPTEPVEHRLEEVSTSSL